MVQPTFVLPRPSNTADRLEGCRLSTQCRVHGKMLRDGLLVLCVIASCVCHQRPHIVVIMADDMGWNDVGFHGSDQIPTPNIDALAYSGVILNKHYTLPTCTPTRTAFLTGRYPIRSGMQGYPLRAGEPRGIPLGETLLPERLRSLGYVTRLVGKWHVGCHKSRYLPTERGFLSHLGHWNGYMGYRDHSIQQKSGSKMMSGADLHREMETAWDLRGQYATHVYTREAQHIIASHNVSQPLYLQLAHLAVHSGNETLHLEVPDEHANNRLFSYIQDASRRRYAGMVAALDESVGKVVAALADRGMLNNSVVVFLSDNGAQTYGLHANSGSNWPLRGLKFTVFEGGVRTACVIWSALLGSPGTVSKQLVHVADWLPTLFAIAGGNVSDLGEIDGVNQWPAISQPGEATPPRDNVLMNIDTAANMESVICGQWKLVRGSYQDGIYDQHCGASGRDGGSPRYDVDAVLKSAVATAIASFQPGSTNLSRDGMLRLRAEAMVMCGSAPEATTGPVCNATCLFDLEVDPCEVNNVAAAEPQVVAALAERLDLFRALMVPQLNQPPDVNSDPALHNGSWVPWLDDGQT